MNANLIHLKKTSFKGEDDKQVVGYVANFLVEPTDISKYVPNVISFWISEQSQLAYLLEMACNLALQDGESRCDVSGLAFCDISFKYDKNKKLQKLKYIRVKEFC